MSTALRPPREEDFTSPLRGEWLTARIGVLLGVCFALAFLTGLVSHELQQPDPLVALPTVPAWGYRVTQALHVLSGTAAIPLLLVKLWSVYPKLFAAVPRGQVRELTLHLLERASIAVLVAAALMQLATGLMNSAQWYPFSFSFRATHFAVAWVVTGALVVHIAVKLPVIRSAFGAPEREAQVAADQGPSRRTLLRGTYLAAGLAVLASAGSSVPLLRKVSVLSVRTGEGPQGLPINRSAQAAAVGAAPLAQGYALEVVNGDRTVRLSRAQLGALRQRTHDLPIACVEGWSASGSWTGPSLRDVLDLVGAPAGSDVVIGSFQRRGAFGTTSMASRYVEDDRTLLALRLNGEDLSLDHGFPCRVIAPNRPGVLQTKWVRSLEVST